MLLHQTKGGFVNETVMPKKFRPSPVPAGGLEIPLYLKYLCSKQAAFEKIKMFVQIFYDYNYGEQLPKTVVTRRMKRQ